MKAHLSLAAAAMLGVAGFVLPHQAQADILFTTGAISGRSTAYDISSGDVADQFTLSADSTLTGVSFGSWNNNGVISALNWSIDAIGVGNTLGSVLDSGNAAVSNVYSGVLGLGTFPVYTSSFTLPPVALTSGSYYLDLSGATGATTVGWDVNNAAFGSLLYNSSPRNMTASFTITGTTDSTAVPEPVSMGLLGTGLLGLIAVRRRRG